MWVLMYVFSYSVSPAATTTGRNGGSARNSRMKRDTGSSAGAATKVKSGLEDLKSIGKGDPAQISVAFNVECLAK
jgi:hypothetical protein